MDLGPIMFWRTQRRLNEVTLTHAPGDTLGAAERDEHVSELSAVAVTLRERTPCSVVTLGIAALSKPRWYEVETLAQGRGFVLSAQALARHLDYRRIYLQILLMDQPLLERVFAL